MHRGTDPVKVEKARQSICDILDDHSQALQNERSPCGQELP